ncbi:hypothetical protein BA896_004385 [Janthinobacterium lividum]|uniref:Uncharacterized protein n=1 Tax=Janthinobacterium lividum TaxID=29581 RepID=A0A1E8PPU5_9BURK|nr:hypothetical protein BA896_004385 [Janthinobacterium lividum]
MHKIMHKMIAGFVYFPAISVMLTQQSRPVSFIVTTSNGAAGAGWNTPSADAQGRRRTGATMGVRFTMHHARYV